MIAGRARMLIGSGAGRAGLFCLGKAQTRKSGRRNWVLAAEGPETFDWREAEDYLGN